MRRKYEFDWGYDNLRQLTASANFPVMEHERPVPAEQYPSFQNNSSALIVSSGSGLSNAGIVVYDLATKALDCGLVSASIYSGSDEATAAAIYARDTAVIAELGKPFAVSEILLNGERAPGNRTEETNLGDFAADALLYGSNQATGNIIDAAITNGGGIRDSIQAGHISMLDMRTVFPFNNQICVLPITGQGLLETLDLNKTYYIATNDFSAAGGDTYYTFKEAYEAGGFNTGVALEDALIHYTKDALGGVITKEKYGAPQERIQIIGSAEPAQT